MKRLLTSLWMCAVTVVAAHAADTGGPVFHKYSFSDKGIVIRISDNGQWVVVEPAYVDDRKSGRAKLVNIATDESQTLQTEDQVLRDGVCGVCDVSDDGNIIAGSYSDMPAYYTKASGTWTKLPIPAECSSGKLLAVTADGKYAVGVCKYAENEYWEKGAMWDLTANTMVDLPNIPKLDMTHEDQKQYKFTDISPDGRYILASMSYSYLQPTALCSYVYDRQDDTYKFIGFTPSDTKKWTPAVDGMLYIDAPAMSPNGQWVTALAYMAKSNGSTLEEYETPVRYEVATGKFELYDEEESHGMAGFSVDNSGAVYGATPASSSPLREWSVRYNGYWYPFSLILSQHYGIDYYDKTRYDYTGTVTSVAGDGQRLASMVSPTGDSYVVELSKTASELCAGINLLSNYVVTPASGSVFTSVKTVEVTFDRSIEVLGDRDCAVLKDKDGKVVRNSVSCAVSNKSDKILVVTFRTLELNKGEKYTVEIPAGALCLAGDELKTNETITLEYTGRGAGAVTAESIYPADGSEIAKIDGSTSPVMVTFDAGVVATDTASAQLLRADGSLASALSVLASGNRIAIYPASTQYLYLNNNYKVVLKAGSVTDVTGSGANEELVISYTGTYERQLPANDTLLFADDFSNMSQSLNNFLRYDGDKNTPTEEMAAMEFDAENQPWNFSIRDNSSSTDLCAASHSMYTPAGKSDDWMVIPRVFLTDANCLLTFDAQSYRKTKTDRLKIYVWQNDEVVTFLNDEVMKKFKAEAKLVFDEQLSPGLSEDELADDWTHYTVALSEFGGKNVYIGFVNDNENQSMVFVDNIKVKRNLKYMLSLNNEEAVVDQTSAAISGKLTVNSENDTYTSVSLTLKDAGGNVVDAVSETGLSLKKNDTYSFSFAKELPLVKGEDNKFTIDVKLDDYTDIMSSSIKNLAFRPLKRVVLEEVTGITCVNCPQGIIAIEKLAETYKEQFIPISIHTYTGDPMGTGLEGYSSALGLSAAPSAKVNRGDLISYPMWQNPITAEYELSNGTDLWTDLVAQELDIPADADISAEVEVDKENGTFSLPVTVNYALNAKSLNLNLFVVVMEDGIVSYQQNGFASMPDAIFGEWGQGGLYGNAVAYNVTHNDVVRSYYGSVNGTGGYLPQSMTAGTEYTAELSGLELPENVTDLAKTKVVVMLIDANTDRLINSVCVKFPEYAQGIGGVSGDADGYSFSLNGGEVSVTGAGETALTLYTTAGAMLGQAKGEGTVSVSAGGYKGTVIVKATGKAGTTVRKYVIR